MRLAPDFRQSAEAIQNLRIGVQGPNCITQIPLSEVATVKLVSGASYIYREKTGALSADQVQRAYRDLGSAIQEAQAKIAEQVTLPRDRASNGSANSAICKMPLGACNGGAISLGLIALLLWINFGSVPDTLLAMSVIPMAVIGGIFGLIVTGVPFSVSAAIGFIALFGISVMDGIIISRNTIS